MKHLFENGLCPAAVAMAQAMPHRAPECLVRAFGALLREGDKEAARQARIVEPRKPVAPNVIKMPLTKWQLILNEIAIEHGQSVDDIRGARRHRQLVRARQHAAYRLRTETEMSFTQIGRVLRRDHTTIIHSVGMYAAENGLPCPDASAKNVAMQRRGAA